MINDALFQVLLAVMLEVLLFCLLAGSRLKALLALGIYTSNILRNTMNVAGRPMFGLFECLSLS